MPRGQLAICVRQAGDYRVLCAVSDKLPASGVLGNYPTQPSLPGVVSANAVSSRTPLLNFRLVDVHPARKPFGAAEPATHIAPGQITHPKRLVWRGLLCGIENKPVDRHLLPPHFQSQLIPQSRAEAGAFLLIP